VEKYLVPSAYLLDSSKVTVKFILVNILQRKILFLMKKCIHNYKSELLTPYMVLPQCEVLDISPKKLQQDQCKEKNKMQSQKGTSVADSGHSAPVLIHSGANCRFDLSANRHHKHGGRSLVAS